MIIIVNKLVLFLGFNTNQFWSISWNWSKLRLYFIQTPPLHFYQLSIYLVSFNQGRSGGGRYLCAPPRPPLEPEAGSNILNLQNINSDFFIFLSINNVTICPFYDNFSNSFLYLNLIFFAGFHLKFISVSQSNCLTQSSIRFK